MLGFYDYTVVLTYISVFWRVSDHDLLQSRNERLGKYSCADFLWDRLSYPAWVF